MMELLEKIKDMFSPEWEYGYVEEEIDEDEEEEEEDGRDD
tara:strand:+ start:217 stop:336 length:120 start_codon:yes stop_codon:yes gene_type:complete